MHEPLQQLAADALVGASASAVSDQSKFVGGNSHRLCQGRPGDRVTVVEQRDMRVEIALDPGVSSQIVHFDPDLNTPLAATSAHPGIGRALADPAK
jgi:hypothetical protein